MRLLLDTHALIWWLTDSPKLSRAARTVLADPEIPVCATAVSGYEIAYKQRLGKLPAEIPADLPKPLRDARIPAHHLTLDHMVTGGHLPAPASRSLGPADHGPGDEGRVHGGDSRPGLSRPRRPGLVVRVSQERHRVGR
jgi:PIN domain nuclease of toxin-antitoxin system